MDFETILGLALIGAVMIGLAAAWMLHVYELFTELDEEAVEERALELAENARLEILVGVDVIDEMR
jgi:hypothetical protein